MRHVRCGRRLARVCKYVKGIRHASPTTTTWSTLDVYTSVSHAGMHAERSSMRSTYCSHGSSSIEADATKPPGPIASSCSFIHKQRQGVPH